MIILRHEIGIEWADKTKERRALDLIIYGNPDKYSAMAASVGFPVGIVTKMIVEGIHF